MLLYRSLVTNALINEVEPLLRKLVNDALTRRPGPNWYETHGQQILCRYEDYNKLKARIDQGLTPIETLDLSALFFLLFPYDEATGKPLSLPVSVLPYFAEYCGKTEDQCKALQRIRAIRNNAIHDDCDNKKLVPSQEYLVNGQQESKWLADIEEIMKRFSPSFHLTSYKDELAHMVSDRQGQAQASNPFAAVIDEAESIRRECGRIYHFDVMEAPLASPLAGAAPWAAAHSDLDALPWPSQQASRQQVPPASRPAPPPPPPAPPVSDPLSDLAREFDRFLGFFSGRG